MLLKKFKIEQWYREHLQLISSEYDAMKDIIISSLDDEDFIKLNDDNIRELYNILDAPTSKIRRKGDNND